ncbi:DNA-binding Lrp family transcriptional regulator [Rhodopseudomonas julia]|uniref:DNA-binding Lrp family transcriptional regulator n=1 Tax=Rhodopseudomonas julia TaxID=200617 RepID=A0ABU0C211_9BRAD|nr:Lrp/AsnC family transcriptional regulator [Rhodopseudomonas julia]MDQ0324552.1 DNA-binding Lrp family transcriptional regulator [Rhodopseudomonas julia]
MDDKDRALLVELQRNARLPIAELADRAGLSNASVQRRLKALREDGVIQSEVALLDRQKLGLGVTAVILVDLERDRLDQIDAFKRKARAEPQVLHLYCIAGEMDFVMIAVARDMADYEALTHRLFFADANVRKFRTSIVVSTEKASSEYPILP